MKTQQWYSLREIFEDRQVSTSQVSSSVPLQCPELGVDLPCHWELGYLRSPYRATYDERASYNERATPAPAPGQFLVMNVESLPPSLTNRSVDPYMLRQALLDQHVVLLSDNSPFSLTLTTPVDSFHAPCKLWARIAIDRVQPSGRQHRQRAAKVDLAYRRGIFDRHLRSQADDRLAMRPLQDELRAMKDSEWVPEEHWMFGTCSGHWRSDSDHRWYEDPIPEALDWTSPDIQVRVHIDPDLLF